PYRLIRRGGHSQLDPAQDLPEHGAHFHLCEGGTEAAAYPTAEGQPDRRIRPVVEEALGLELLRVGVVPAAVLHQVDTGHQGDTRRQVVPAQPEVSSELAAELEDHRPHPQAFLAYR